MKNKTEAKLQQGCVYWFRVQYPNFSRLLFAVPNGGSRNGLEAQNLKRQGVLAGVSDVIFLKGNSKYNSLCIEFKTEKGRQSPLQKEFQKVVESVGNKYVIIRSVSEFIKEITNYLKEE